MTSKFLWVVLSGITFISGCQSTKKEVLVGQENASGAEIPPGLSLHSWNNYHWARQTASFTLKVGDNLTTADWKALLTKTSGDWNNPAAVGATSTPLMTAIVPGIASKRCSMVSGTTQICNGLYGKNGWLGLASISISGAHITLGTAKMNDSYFSTATYNNPNEKLHVMCQELAHTFGLDHQSTDGSSQNSCMDYFSNTGANANSVQSTTPNAHDFEELTTVYAHADTTTTAAASSASASGAAVTDDPQSWGELKSQNASGKASVYEHRNHDGSVTLTHVYWTDEAAGKCPSCDHRSN